MKNPVFGQLIIILLLLVGIINLSAQSTNKIPPTPEPSPSCPTVSVSCPDSVLTDEPLTFTANVSGGDPNVTPTFNWTVSNGTISSGQGTSSITVDTEGLKAGASITATVDIGGFDRTCRSSNSCSASVIKNAESPKSNEITKEQQLKIYHKIWNHKILFNKGKETISPQSTGNVQIIADLFKQLPQNISMEIGSYTDNVGPRNLNLTLSQRRAEVLKMELVKLGISATRLKAVGYGNAKPSSDKSAKIATQYVEFKFIG